jgi:hypothetical protein
MSGIPFCRAGPGRPSVTDPSSVTDGRTDRQTRYFIYKIGGPKGKALYLHIETSIISILGKFPKFQLVVSFLVRGESKWLIVTKEKNTWEVPPSN